MASVSAALGACEDVRAALGPSAAASWAWEAAGDGAEEAAGAPGAAIVLGPDIGGEICGEAGGVSGAAPGALASGTGWLTRPEACGVGCRWFPITWLKDLRAAAAAARAARLEAAERATLAARAAVSLASVSGSSCKASTRVWASTGFSSSQGSFDKMRRPDPRLPKALSRWMSKLVRAP